MDTKKLQLAFFFTLLFAVFVLVAFIFEPFIAPIALAFMAAIIVKPVDNWFMKMTKNRRTISAVLSVIFALLVILIPLSILIQRVLIESFNFYVDIREGGLGGFDHITWYLIHPVQSIFPDFNPDILGYIRSYSDGLVANAQNIIQSTASIVLSTFIAFIALFYMLRDGARFRKAIVELSPLADQYDNNIIDKVEKAVDSVVRGSLFTSLIKGVLASLGFLMFGVPHPLLWGTLTAIVSLLPGIGAGLTLIPAVLFLLATDHMGAAVGLTIWGVIAVGLVDNILMPIVVSKGFTVHPLLVLISVLGGIIFFGPVGLFLGPLVIALFAALLEIYKLVILDDKNKKTTSV